MKLKLSQLHTYNNKIGPESPNKGGRRLTLEGQPQCHTKQRGRMSHLPARWLVMKSREVPKNVSIMPTAPLFLITPPGPHATVVLCISEL